jgi:hypothetical protein
MALYYDLPVFKDVYQLILKIFDYTNHFPREYKFTLGQDLKRDGINLVRSIYRANKALQKTNETLTAPTRNWRLSGYIKLCASYQVQWWQTVFVSEIANFL